MNEAEALAAYETALRGREDARLDIVAAVDARAEVYRGLHRDDPREEQDAARRAASEPVTAAERAYQQACWALEDAERVLALARTEAPA